MTQQEQIQKFKNETGYTLKVKDGKPYYGGALYLQGTGITSLPDNLTVGGGLDLEGCTGITALPDNLTVGGYLYLSGTGITSLPDNLTVGGWLDLNGCTGITSLPDNLTVGGGLDLEGCTGITALPDNLTVGGYLYLSGTGITDTSHVRRQLTAEQRKKISLAENPLLQWEFGGRKYIKIDGIFSQVLQQRGNVYRTRQLNGQEGYLITDGEGNYAHGDTLEEARADLLFKISDRDKSAYEKLTLESSLPFDDAVVCYRVITGACSPGTRDYIANRLPQPRKEAYTIGEMIELTRGEYGGKTFEEFFNK